MVILITTVLALSGCAFQNLGKFDENQSSPNSESENTPLPRTYTIGDTISTENFAITLNGSRSSSAGALGLTPDMGKFLILDLTIQNKSDESNSISSLLMFDLQGSDSKRYDVALFADVETTMDGSVNPGGKLRGEIAFDVPDLEFYVLSYRNDILADPVEFKIPNN